MTKAEIEHALVQAIVYVQEESRGACPSITGSTRPIGDVEGFDSLNGVEVGAKIAEDLGFKVQDNPFIDSNGRSLSVSAAACSIFEANSESARVRSERAL